MLLIRFSFWKDFTALKAEDDKLEINKLFLHQVVWITFKTVNDLDVKNCSCGLEKFSDAVENEVFKNTKFNTLKTIYPDATALIHINQ